MTNQNIGSVPGAVATFVSVPGAHRGSRAGSPRGVVDATGSSGTLKTERDLLIRSLPLPVLTRAIAVVFSICLAVSNLSAAPCSLTSADRDRWVAQRINQLVLAARLAYIDDKAQPRYERAVNAIANSMSQCRLAADRDFVARYPEFVEYLRVLSLPLKADHELGFEVTDKVYFAETSAYTAVPDFLLTPQFLRAVSRFENLPQAKAMLRDMNARRAQNDQLIFFSYASRHLGTPDNPDSYRRLLIVVPGNAAQHVPEKWVQFGIADPRRPASVRNVSVVAVLPGQDETTNVYFKDYFRTYRRNGSITIKGRWELGEGDDYCVSCHKSGVLPIFPVAGSVGRDEESFVETVNERFLSYGTERFDRYLDATKFGPGLGSNRSGELYKRATFDVAGTRFKTTSCSSCHKPNQLGSLNWPMDSTLISSFVEGGKMPLGAELPKRQRSELYQHLVDDYFSIDDARPGILKAWLLGKNRNENAARK